ncbi:MAG: hypothetical protein CL607_03350 [Anaerolineaceae bacterium]|nr:hypothetical protein [Anaerolineaceae bacterium]
MNRPQRNLPLFLATILVLLFFLTRVWALTAFPMFIDEGQHVFHGQEIAASGPLANAVEGRQFTYWYFLAFQPGDNSSLFVIRAATILVVTVGFSALLASGRILAGVPGMVFIGIAYTLSTYHFFYDRLALADTLAGSVMLVAVYFSLRLGKRYSLWDAVFVGISLFTMVMFKLTTLAFFGIPVAAVLFIRNAGITWKQRITWAGTALLVAGGLFGSYILLAAWRGYNPFGLLLTHNTAETSHLLTRWLANVGDFAGWISSYLSAPVFLLLMAACVVLLVRRDFFLLAVAFAPLAVQLINPRQTPRYWVGAVAILLLILSVVIGRLWPRMQRAVQWAIVGAVGAYTVIIWLPFVIPAYTHPADIPLPTHDQRQYIESDGSGFGVREMADIVRQEEPTQVIGLIAHCWALLYMSSDLPVLCPPINPDGSEVEALTQLLAESRQEGVYVITENSPYVPAGIPGEIITTLKRPGDLSTLTLYDLSPEAE